MTDSSPTPSSAPASELSERYLDLLRRTLTREIGGERQRRYDPVRPWVKTLATPVQGVLDRMGLEVVHHYDPAKRTIGADWPAEAETMIGSQRLRNVQDCVAAVVTDGVPGDIVECGVWRGGATILMAATLLAYGDTDRVVWAADSFEGLPAPDANSHPADRDDPHHTLAALAVSLDEVKANFEKFGLLTDRVRFLEGWFSDTLATAPIEQISVLRLDGDMYGSTMDALTPLYPKVNPGGFVIVDDYNSLEPCKRAVDEYRAAHGVTEPIVEIDRSGIFWRLSTS